VQSDQALFNKCILAEIATTTAITIASRVCPKIREMPAIAKKTKTIGDLILSHRSIYILVDFLRQLQKKDLLKDQHQIFATNPFS
jgi:hypothetical protein